MSHIPTNPLGIIKLVGIGALTLILLFVLFAFTIVYIDEKLR